MQHFDPGAHPYSRICYGLKDSLVPWQDAPHSCEGAVPGRSVFSALFTLLSACQHQATQEILILYKKTTNRNV